MSLYQSICLSHAGIVSKHRSYGQEIFTDDIFSNSRFCQIRFIQKFETEPLSHEKGINKENIDYQKQKFRAESLVSVDIRVLVGPELCNAGEALVELILLVIIIFSQPRFLFVIEDLFTNFS